MSFENMVKVLMGEAQAVVDSAEAGLQSDVTASRVYTKGVLTMKVDFQPKWRKAGSSTRKALAYREIRDRRLFESTLTLWEHD